MSKVSMTQVAAALGVLQRFKKVRKGSFDGSPVTILDSRVHASPDGMRLAVTFRLGESQHQVEADHDWRDTRAVIRVDGKDVEKDDVDLDFRWRPSRVDLAYRLEYEQEGSPHVLVFTAPFGL